MHETQLILYDGAERMLLKMGLDPKSVSAEEIRNDYEAMKRRKLILEKTYKNAGKDAASLRQKMSNIEQYLEPEASHDSNKEQPSDKSKGHNRS